MNVIVVIEAGRVVGIHRTVDGVAHLLAAHASDPMVSGVPLSIEALSDALADGAATATFSDAADLLVERHAVVV